MYKSMMDRVTKWDWFTTISLVVTCGFLVAMLGAMVVCVCMRDRGEGVETEEDGDFKIVEVETRGERHEYLYYHQMYRGSMCHLPNCKYCRKMPAVGVPRSSGSASPGESNVMLFSAR